MCTVGKDEHDQAGMAALLIRHSLSNKAPAYEVYPNSLFEYVLYL